MIKKILMLKSGGRNVPPNMLPSIEIKAIEIKDRKDKLIGNYWSY